MERIFFRERKEERELQGAKQLNIGVTGLGRGTGTTFVATALAFYFRDQGESVTFVQCLDVCNGRELLYDSVAMEQRFARRTYLDVYQRIREGMSWQDRRNQEEGIHWILPRRSQDGKEALDAVQKQRMVLSVRDEVCIFDFEADYSWDNLLMDMDVVVVVADPLPSKLIGGAGRFTALKKLELSGSKVVWAVNRDNDGVSRRQVQAYLKGRPDIWIPVFPADTIYRCEYSCNFFWKDEEIKRKMMEIFTKVSQFWTSL